MAGFTNEVYYVDGIRTAFGKAGPKGVFFHSRADDLAVKVIRTLMERNPSISKDMIDDNIWGAASQIGDQGLTVGRTTAILSGLSVETPGAAVDRMCAGGMTAICFGASEIATGAADIVIAGGVEHMGKHPMGQGADPNPRFIAEKLVDTSALNMGLTAENLHDMFPEITKDMADEYGYYSQMKATKAYKDGKIQKTMVPMTVWSPDGWKVADKDEQLRPETTLEGLKELRTPFRVNGRVSAGNASGLNDGAGGCILASKEACEKFGLKPKMRIVGYAFAGVRPEVMGLGPIPSTKKLFERTGLSVDQMDYLEVNEAFAVQVIAFMNEFGLKDYNSDRLNPWGGAISLGHPLAASGTRLIIQMEHLFDLDPSAKYGLTTMCVGLGQGGSVIWENV